MASTPVKTLLVERYRAGLSGSPASADTTALKGKSAPERVRQFESLLEQTGKVTPRPKPTSVRHSDATGASSSKDTVTVQDKLDKVPAGKSAQPESDTKTVAPQPSEVTDPTVDDAANIADTVTATPDATAGTPVSEPASDSPASEDDAVQTADTLSENVPSADPALLVSALPLPVPVAIPAPPANTVDLVSGTSLIAADVAPQGVVPVDADLSKQEPVTLPQAPFTEPSPVSQEDAAAPLLAALETAPLMESEVAPPPPAPGARAATPAPVSPQPASNQAQPQQPDAIIESLTVITAAPVDHSAQPSKDSEAAPQTLDSEPTQDVIAAQAAAATPIVSENQPKGKVSAQKPGEEPAAAMADDSLPTLTTAGASTTTESETPPDQNGSRDQSHGDKARDRGQDRAQAGERLAAKMADSQASLIRDEAALSGPVQTFKAALKASTADVSASASTGTAPDQSAKAPSTPQLVTAAIAANASASGQQTTSAAKSAARAAPVFHTPVVQQVGTRLVETAENGGGRVVMDLRPEHLGRVTIDVDVRDDGRVIATVLVDNPEALDQLRRDGSQLEQALRDSGLNPDQNSLNFGLREQAQDQGGFGRDGRGRRTGTDLNDTEAELPEAPTPTQQSVVPGLGVIDIRI